MPEFQESDHVFHDDHEESRMTERPRTWRDELIARYPAMFVEYPDYSSGYPGVDDGWRDLVETAVERLATILRERPGTSLVIDQIKEKFGRLRLYSHGSYMADAETREREGHVVDLAGARSACTCEICGAEGRLYDRHGWLSTACAKHGRIEPVPLKPDYENLVVTRELRDGRLRIVKCRRYLRDEDVLVDVDPASIGLEE
jgi:hypothetical protein